MLKGSCLGFNEGAGDVAPHCNSSPLNGTTNPCRDDAVHTIGLPSMWRNIPATRSHTHQFAIIMKWCRFQKTDRRKDVLIFPGDSAFVPFFFFLLRPPFHLVYN